MSQINRPLQALFRMARIIAKLNTAIGDSLDHRMESAFTWWKIGPEC